MQPTGPIPNVLHPAAQRLSVLPSVRPRVDEEGRERLRGEGVAAPGSSRCPHRVSLGGLGFTGSALGPMCLSNLRIPDFPFLETCGHHLSTHLPSLGCQHLPLGLADSVSLAL